VNPAKERPVPVWAPSEEKVTKPILVEESAKVADKIPEIPNALPHSRKAPEATSPVPSPTTATENPPASDVANQLAQVTSLLDLLNKKVESQSELIAALTKELATVKNTVDCMASEEIRKKDEIIRELVSRS
jgi:coronin-1B/1C/6